MRKRVRLGISLVTIIAVISFISSTIGYSIVQGQTLELVHFILTHFAGYLFFIILPVEALIPLYLAAGHNAILLFFLAITTAIIAQSIDYAIGVLFPIEKLRDFVGHKKYDKVMKVIDKYGPKIVFTFSLFPLSSPVVILAAGIMRYGYVKTILYSLLGLSLKYAVIIGFFVYLY